MIHHPIGCIVCTDERLCRLLENELAYLGIHALSHREAPDVADGISILLWDCDSTPSGEGVTAAHAHGCPILLFGRATPEIELPETALFLRRPFALTELEKALHRLCAEVPSGLRTPYAPPSPPQTIPPATPLLTACDGKVTIGDKTVPLTPAEWEIFKYLYDHRGEAVPRDTRAPLLGGGGNSVDVYICHLRTKIEKPLGRRMIHTVRGIGYRLDK